jgi:integral membrane protein
VNGIAMNPPLELTFKDPTMLTWFRKIAIAEGISFLVLLLIAMPLKYFAGWPMAVKVVGWAHGLLFVAFLVMAWEVKNLLGRNLGWYTRAFIASIVPFGTFVLEKELKKEQQNKDEEQQLLF